MNRVLAVLLVLVVTVQPVPADTAAANERPLADAGLDQRAEWGSTVYLDGGGSRDPDGEIRRVEWTIETPNGTTITPKCGTCLRTAFTPSQAGRYTVTLRVTDDDGATATDTLYVTVDPGERPSVSLSGPRTVTVGVRRTFTARVERGSPPISRVVWARDGTEITTRSPGSGPSRVRVRFPAPGTYEVRTTVVDAAGRRATATRTVVALPRRGRPGGGGGPGGGNPGGGRGSTDPNAAPSAMFGVDRSAPREFRFDASLSSDPDGSIARYEWRFGDGSTATGRVVSHEFAGRGEFTVTLRVTDAAGSTATATKTVTVRATPPTNRGPSASLSVSDTTPEVGQSVTVSAVDSRDPDGVITGYRLSLGDGTTGARARTAHTYTSPGTYTVGVTVVDDAGATDRATTRIRVRPRSGADAGSGSARGSNSRVPDPVLNVSSESIAMVKTPRQYTEWVSNPSRLRLTLSERFADGYRTLTDVDSVTWIVESSGGEVLRRETTRAHTHLENLDRFRSYDDLTIHARANYGGTRITAFDRIDVCSVFSDEGRVPSSCYGAESSLPDPGVDIVGPREVNYGETANLRSVVDNSDLYAVGERQWYSDNLLAIPPREAHRKSIAIEKPDDYGTVQERLAIDVTIDVNADFKDGEFGTSKDKEGTFSAEHLVFVHDKLQDEKGALTDSDGDGVADIRDNCPNKSNPSQNDRDDDSRGDSCEPSDGSGPIIDSDDDGKPDRRDNCPHAPNFRQNDGDGDGIGDVCDNNDPSDIDGDGIPNEGDNCEYVHNKEQADRDGDGNGDKCEMIGGSAFT